jgi:hypothetical protein
VVESSGLLNRRRVKNSTGGSNPPLSAIMIDKLTTLTCAFASNANEIPFGKTPIT